MACRIAARRRLGSLDPLSPNRYQGSDLDTNGYVVRMPNAQYMQPREIGRVLRIGFSKLGLGLSLALLRTLRVQPPHIIRHDHVNDIGILDCCVMTI